MKEFMAFSAVLTWAWNSIELASVVLVSLFAVGVFTFMTLSVVNTYRLKKQSSSLEMNTSNVCIYIYNLDDRTIRYFEKHNMSDQRVTTDDAFFSSFQDRSDAEKIHNWIYSYVYDSSPESFLTVKSIEKSGRECLSLYRITAYDKKKNILHFEKTLLPKISTNNAKFSSIVRFGFLKNPSTYIKKMSDVENYAAKSKKPHACVCYYVCLAPLISITPETTSTKTVTQRSLYVTSIYQPLNNVQQYLSKKRNLVMVSDKEAIIFDFSSTFRTDIISFCNTILNEIQRYFAVKDLSSLYEIAIGVDIFEGKGVSNFRSCINRARSLANKAALKENVNYLIEGEEGADTPSFDAGEIRTEISSLVKNSTFRTYFTPVMSTEFSGPVYLVNIVPYGTSYRDFNSLVEAASKVGMLSQLLNIIFNFVTTMLRGEHAKGIINLPYVTEEAVMNAFHGALGSSDCVMIGLDKDDIQELYDADVDVEMILANFNNAGISLCLTCPDGEVDNPMSILSYFSCFYISFSEKKVPLHGNEKRMSQLISCFSVLQSHKKPIIVSELLSEADISLAAELGFKSFVSSQLAPASSVPYSWKERVESGESKSILPRVQIDTPDEAAEKNQTTSTFTALKVDSTMH